MPEPVYEAWLSPAAKAFLNELPRSRRERVRRLIRIIEIDPFVNGRAKVLIDLDGLKQNLYIDPEDWIYYHLQTMLS